MDKVYEMSLLLDFYGQMLTDRQYEIMDLHFNNDYSLGEISSQLGISRQGVHENIKRAKAMLSLYEEKLSLVNKFTRQREQAEKALELLVNIDKTNLDESLAQGLDSIEKIIRDIIV